MNLATPGRPDERRQGGFTLPELLVIVTILGVLASVVVFSVSGLTAGADSAALGIDARVLRTAEETYRAVNGTYADELTLEGKGLLSQPSRLHDIVVIDPDSYLLVCLAGAACPPSTDVTPADTSTPLAVMLQEAQATQSVLPPQPGTFGLPLAAPVTSPFGFRVDPIAGGFGFHPGIDYGAPLGTPIAAAGVGVVLVAGSWGGYGNLVVIDHGNGLATIYGHQSALAVTVGQAVTAGQTIGLVGTTGYSTGPHLHFEVRAAGSPVDPLLYL